MTFGSKDKGARTNHDAHLNERYSRIRSLVTDDNVEEAIKELQALIDGRDVSIANDLIGLQARLRRVKKDEIAGSLNLDQAYAEKNRINQSLLHLIDEIDVRPIKHAPLRELTPAEKKRRANYLQDLNEDVENRLRVSIHHARLIDLGIDDTPSATYLPWIYTDVNSKHDFKDYHEAFETYDRRMLLLGSPGSGKTVTLLHIAQQLIAEAQKDENAPVPLLVNLSKFQPSIPQSRLFGFISRKRSEIELSDKRIEHWLGTEFTVNPDISDEIAKTWIGEGRIAALLDGLDEVNDEYRAELVQILNKTYLKDHPDVVVVVCSRINEYRPLQDREETRVELKGGITLQPLTKSKIEEYLVFAQATGLRDALLTDETLYQMAQTPLTLSMMTLAYGGRGPSSLPSHLSFTERRHHLMDAYVAKMLQRKERRDKRRLFDEDPTRDVPVNKYAYRPATINRLLGWLAVRMSVRMQTAISLHRLYSFLTRDITRDRQAGIWWATILSRTPLILVSTLLAGIVIAPMTKQAWLQVLYISLLGSILLAPITWLFRSFDGESNTSFVGKINLSLLSAALVVAGFANVGIAVQALSSILPFGIPAVPTAILATCLTGPLVWLLGTLEEDKSKPQILCASTLVVFLISLLVMKITHSHYGWYIPTVSVLTLQMGWIVLSVLSREGWQSALATVFAILGLIPGIVAIVKFTEGFQWYVPLLCYVSVAVVIVGVTRRALLPLIGFLLFFVLGGLWGEDRGAIVGALIFGYLILFGFLIVSNYEPKDKFLGGLDPVVERSLTRFDEIADYYLFSPVVRQILAVTRCLPIRSGRFFQYAEQALLLKRSAGDIEFMHRLLRDYFALRDLQPLLVSSEFNRRLQAIRNLGFQGDAAIDALAEFVRNAEPDVREAAAWALGKVVSPSAVPHIETALIDEDPKVRRAAIFSTKNLTLGEQNRLLEIVIDDADLSVQRAVFEVVLAYSWGRTALHAQLLTNLQKRIELRQIVFDLTGDNKTEQEIRYAAIRILRQLKDPDSVAYLIRALTDRNFRSREFAANVLGEFDDPRAVQELIKARSDRSKELQNAATEALQEIQSRGVLHFKF